MKKKSRSLNTILIGVVLAVIILVVLVFLNSSTGYAIFGLSFDKAPIPVCGDGVCKQGEGCEWYGGTGPNDPARQMMCDGIKSYIPEGGSCHSCVYYAPTSVGCGDGICQTGETCEWNGAENRQMMCDGQKSIIPTNKRCSACTIYDNTPIPPSEEGVAAKIPLGSLIASRSATTYLLNYHLDDQDINKLLDTEITFSGNNYETAEIIQFGQATGPPTIETSLTSGVDPYATSVRMNVPRDSLKYYYIFDEPIPLSQVRASNPLTLQFLGTTIEVVQINSNTQFTAHVGGQYYLVVGDSIVVEGKIVALENVGSAGAIVVSVNGVQETIEKDGTETINGIEIVNYETFYEDNIDQRSATLIIGSPALVTVNDGDEFLGESESDPDWVWNVGGLKSDTYTTHSDTAEYNGPYFGVENDFQIDDNNDNPPTVGDCIDLPNHYVSVCIDSLTVQDTAYTEIEIEDENNADLSDANPQLSSAGAIYFTSSSNDGLLIQTRNFVPTPPGGGTPVDIITDKIWLHPQGNTMEVYYSNPDNDVMLAGAFPLTSSPMRFAVIQSANGKVVPLDYLGTSSLAKIVVATHDSKYLPHSDNITSIWKINPSSSSTGSVTLGMSAGSEESSELTWNTVIQTGDVLYPSAREIGNTNTNLRTKYGIITHNPAVNGDLDKVKLSIPTTIVLAEVMVKATSGGGSGPGPGGP